MSMNHRSGLHKNISSIFDGVPIPKNGDANTPVANTPPADKTAGHIPPMPSASPKPPQTWNKEPLEDSSKPVQAPKPVAKVKDKSNSPNVLGLLVKRLKDKALTPPEGVSQSRHMAMLVLIPVLLLVVVFVFGRLILQSGVKGKKFDDDSMVSSSSSAKMEIEWKRPAPYPEDLRDPMKKYTYSTPSTTAATAEDIVVRGIVWSEDSPAAVIGTEIIYEGQSVKGTKIINITEDSVEFERDRKKWIQRVAD